MKRKSAMIAGNGLMGLGLLTMIVGISYAVLNQLPQLQLPSVLTPVAILSIFIGALLWLVGARISGREKVADRYYWLRHCGDQRCRRASHQRPHTH
ncbi:stress-induced protein YchH [Erwinia sp. PK3-005]|uniref:Stress-induced protein YchH n=1 Tax=Mixta hanseatica TaxID=2872648 RepID=A0ABY4RE77_9GAMM|nr:stress-induced protein YchH [Mixta hanseatica]UQY45842.1 stress-induced protein YchH [Mixta hanseatica]